MKWEIERYTKYFLSLALLVGVVLPGAASANQIYFNGDSGRFVFGASANVTSLVSTISDPADGFYSVEMRTAGGHSGGISYFRVAYRLASGGLSRPTVAPNNSCKRDGPYYCVFTFSSWPSVVGGFRIYEARKPTGYTGTPADSDYTWYVDVNVGDLDGSKQWSDQFATWSSGSGIAKTTSAFATNLVSSGSSWLSGGALGVGTSDPQYTLDIAGTARWTAHSYHANVMLQSASQYAPFLVWDNGFQQFSARTDDTGNFELGTGSSGTFAKKLGIDTSGNVEVGGRLVQDRRTSYDSWYVCAVSGNITSPSCGTGSREEVIKDPVFGGSFSYCALEQFAHGGNNGGTCQVYFDAATKEWKLKTTAWNNGFSNCRAKCF